MNFGLQNKIAIVAASSEGLGKASAMALAQEGATVVLCARREKVLADAAEEIRSATHSTVEAITADVSKAEDIEKVIRFTLDKYRAVHILVNNAGGPPPGDLLSLTDADWFHAYELTLLSGVRFTRAVLPRMVEQQWGRIISIVSFVAKQPTSDLLISSTLRPGILGFTKALSNIYAQYNITINTVCPGNILTKRQQEIASAKAINQNISYEEYLQQVASTIPANRLGKPEEVGDVVAFLASERASYINGVNLLVDGGVAKGIF